MVIIGPKTGRLKRGRGSVITEERRFIFLFKLKERRRRKRGTGRE